ncbi:MAG: cation diffusion facilitator family transporter [Leptonema sp. (in: bacteria)]
MSIKRKKSDDLDLKKDIVVVYKKNKDLIHPMLFVILLGFLILFLKLFAYYISGSMALKSDALESLVNILAGLFALYSIFYSKRPADKNHPYGHGKMEFFSAIFEGALIVLASILIVYESIEKLILGFELKKISLGLVINFVAGSINGLLGIFLIRIGKKKSSSALKADGYHLLTDFYTTLGIFIGLIFVALTDNIWFDPLLSFLFGLYLLFTGIRIIIKEMNPLLDTENPEILKKIINSINEINDERIISAHGIRIMQSGNYFHIDVHFIVPEFFTVEEINFFIHSYETKVIQHAGLNGEFHSHFDPCKRAYCSSCSLKNCSIRLIDFQHKKVLTYEEAIDLPKEDKERYSLMY